MKTPSCKSEAISTLRHRAEDLIKKKSLHTGSMLSVAEVLRLVHELEVYDIELEMQNEELNRLNDEKDKFFSIIAHDMRSPFITFLTLTQVMVEELPSLTMEKTRELALNMQSSATNLFNLLDNLLTWARMNRGLISLSPVEIYLLPAVEESIGIVIDSARRKGIEIEYDIPHNFKVFSDNNLLKTVIRNLLSNAVKFTPNGGKIFLSASIATNRNVEISVSDTGIGMSKEMVANLFRLDSRINRVGTEGESSTGLGLIICKDFLEKQGGKLWVNSLEGKGSEFKFSLPHHISNLHNRQQPI